MVPSLQKWLHLCLPSFNTGPQVSNVNPKSLCDFNPCEEAGCLYDPTARCITDFECNPIFFNSDGKVISKCKGKTTPNRMRQFLLGTLH